MWPDPLRQLELLAPYTGRVIDWSDVTTITVDDRHDKPVTTCLASITKWHRRFLRPAREVIVSGARPDVDGIEWIRAKKFVGNKREAYSLWCQKELSNHFDTPFVLVWQSDGFVLNPKFWTDDFMRYDYVGSPFYFNQDLVGNGGFSLRSKMFCKEADKLPDLGSVPEDAYFCIDKRRELESKGVRFCPILLAKTWGNELGPTDRGLYECFGFHGRCFLRHIPGFVSGMASKERTLRSGALWNGNSLVQPNRKLLPASYPAANYVANFDLGRK
jgi:hypothetical protein